MGVGLSSPLPQWQLMDPNECYSQTCIKRPSLGYTNSNLLIPGVFNGGDNDHGIVLLGDTKSGLLIQGWGLNEWSFNTSLTTTNIRMQVLLEGM